MFTVTRPEGHRLTLSKCGWNPRQQQYTHGGVQGDGGGTQTMCEQSAARQDAVSSCESHEQSAQSASVHGPNLRDRIGL